MRFETIKTSLISFLGTAAAGRYRTVGYKDQHFDATEILSNSKYVSVIYKNGTFPLDRAGRQGPATHVCQYDVELFLSQKSAVNLAHLEGEYSAAQRAAALAATQNVQKLAATNLDSFIAIIFGVLMDNRNIDLGLSRALIGDRWISGIDVHDIEYFGDTAIAMATLKYEVEVQEDFTGDTGDEGSIIDLTLPLNSELTGQTGIYTEVVED